MNLRHAILLLALLGASFSEQNVFAQSAKQTADARNRMVDADVVAAGVKNPRVIQSMRDTLRHEFCAAAEKKNAYFDMALPIGEGQTISPPFIVAYMTEVLDPQPTEKVLEIGTGSGYQAAILSPLAQEVYSIEIVEPLGKRAAETLKRLKYKNVFTKIGDGYKGWPEHAPFDKIIVTCSPENVPQALVDQLREGGSLIVPLGERYQQTLYRMKKQDGKLVSEALLPMLFVPMTGSAEDQRKVKPDPLHPSLFNGSFEESTGEPKAPLGWYYQRQLKWETDKLAPQGEHYATFSNTQPGVNAQALQGFPVDGREVTELDVSCQVRASDVRPGQNQDQWPYLMITFYDERRGTAGHRTLGPFRGTFSWREERDRLKVPPKAREAILRIGLLGATGEISFDAVEVKRVENKK
jgi:protein-L-isoaspartate(D-aspartate) O-methyltransferase